MKIFIIAVALCGCAVGRILGQDGAPAPKNTNALTNAKEFQTLDAGRQKLAEVFFADVEKQVRGNRTFFVDPVKYSLLAADEAMADLKERNAKAKEDNAKIRESMAKLVAELKQNGVTPDEASCLDMPRLKIWARKHTNETANLPPTLKQKLHANTIPQSLRPEDETVDTLLAPKRLGNGRTVGSLNFSSYYQRLSAKAFDKQKAYDYAYVDAEGSEELYRKFYAKRFSELMEENGGQTGTQIFIDIRTKIASEWRQQNSK